MRGFLRLLPMLSMLLPMLSILTLNAAPDTGKVILVFSGEVSGNFGPCGCAAGPEGGLARRAGHSAQLNRQSQAPVVHLDSGNYLAAPGPNAEPINDFLIDGLDRLPIEVWNLGSEDLYYWPRLQDYEGRTRLVATNLRPRSMKTPSPERYAVVQVRAGDREIRIGFLGLVDPRRVKPNSPFEALDPIESVREVKSAVLQEADFLVVLADSIRPQGSVPRDWYLKRIAEEHPEVHLIVTTERRFKLYEPVRIGSALLLSTVERGRYLTQVTLSVDAEGQVVTLEPDFIRMGEGVASDPEILADQKRVERAIGR